MNFRLLPIIALFSTAQLTAQVNDVQLYTFAHSLIDHGIPMTPAPNNETTILQWIHDISQASGKSFASTGQFGQLTNHVDNLPPSSSLGYANVPNSWDEQETSFANSNLTTVLLTAANFIQYQSPSLPSPLDGQGRSPIALTSTIFDWTSNAKPGLNYYIYGNWPEMDLASEFPPTPPLQSEIDAFHAQTIGEQGDFASWWLAYQDSLLLRNPQRNTRLIPVGRVVSQILRDVLDNAIPFDQLYEDSAPHGTPNVYFLAGMVTYMALFEENIPASYMPPAIIHPQIRNNMEAIRNAAWASLNAFNFDDGLSRVFFGQSSSAQNISSEVSFSLYPNPANRQIRLNFSSNQAAEIKITGIDGRLLLQNLKVETGDIIDVSHLSKGTYVCTLTDQNQQTLSSAIFVKE